MSTDLNKKLSVLVTGATGFIGSHLTRRLLKEGYETHIFTRASSNKWRIKDIASNLHEHIVDLRDQQRVREAVKAINPGYIFHLAIGGVYNSKNVSDHDLFETNLIGTVNLIEAANEINYKGFIYTGSGGEYGYKNEIMKETDACDPSNAYGITKHAATLYARLIAMDKSKPIIILRLFSPFGPGEDLNRLVSYTITRALKNDDLLLANPESVRDFIYIEDVIEAYLKCLGKASRYAGEIFNIGSGKEFKIGYIVEKIKKLTGSNGKIKWNTQSSRPGESPKWQADISKASKLLKWSPAYTLEEGLIKTIEWFKFHEQAS